MIIAVIGGDSSSHPSESALLQAEAVGREVARNGCVLICGGRGGVMEAACRGAVEAGGTTIGVLSGSDKGGANAYVQIPIVTGMGEARNVIVVFTADAVIAVDGAYGTLSEIAHALGNGKPVVGISTWSLSREEHTDDPIYRTQDAAEAVRYAIQAATAKDASKVTHG
jgi:uncharacterized protein (TIGR00725 family)